MTEFIASAITLVIVAETITTGDNRPVIYNSPSTEQFRTQLIPLYDSIGTVKDQGIFFRKELDTSIVEWDGVNRLGERVSVQLIPMDLDRKNKIRKVKLRVDTSEVDRTSLSSPLELVCSAEDIQESEIFVGQAYNFLNWFQTVCKAVEDSLTPNQISGSAVRAKAGFEDLERRIRANPDSDRLGDYANMVYRRFCQELSQVRYLVF